MAKRVYFAFDYKDVAEFRANVVRKSNMIAGSQEAGFYDASIWEEAEKQGATALKRLINRELESTSVTAILVGTRTHGRRWVRYEIMKSLERGNLLLAIHINSIKDKEGITKVKGANPLDNLGMQLNDDGSLAKPTEWKDGKWVWYGDLEPFSKPSWAMLEKGKNYPLSFWFQTYDWVADDGYNNFGDWIE